MALSRSVIKGIQLVLALACLGLHTQSKTSSSVTELVSIAAFAGYLIIIVGYFVARPPTSSVDVFYALVGFAVFAAAAYLNFYKFHNAWDGDEKTYGLIKSGLSLLNCMVFLLEAVLVWRD